MQQGVPRVASLFSYPNGATPSIAFIPQQPLIPEGLLPAMSVSAGAAGAAAPTPSSLLGVTFLAQEAQGADAAAAAGTAESGAAVASVNGLGRVALPPPAATMSSFQLQRKLQMMPAFPFTPHAGQALSRMGSFVSPVPHGIFETASIASSSASSSSSPVIAPTTIVSQTPNASTSSSSANRSTHSVQEDQQRARGLNLGFNLDQLATQNALLLSSFGFAAAGANSPVIAQPRGAFTTPLPNQPSTLLFADQANSSPAVANAASSAQVPLTPHTSNRHSPIRHRRMRRAAENVVRSLSNTSMLRMNSLSAAASAEDGSSSTHRIDSSLVTLTVHQQPPERTVYLKILKPFPVIKLNFSRLPQSEEEKKQLSRLYVEASLISHSSGEDISSCLEGTRMVQVIGNGAIFRKLKILCTSQQQNSNMCLRFTLFQFTSAGCEPCAGCSVTSQLIEVYSHPVYLSAGGSVYAQQQQQAIMASHGQNSAFPHQVSGLRRHRPSDSQEDRSGVTVVSEVVPNVASVGDKVVIVGSNFKDAPTLRVMFGSVIVEPEFNDSSTLLCIVPDTPVENDGDTTLSVKITNEDGSETSPSSAEFCISRPKKVLVTSASSVATETEDAM